MDFLNERIVGLQQRVKKTNAACSQLQIGGECFYCAGNGFWAKAFFAKAADITAYSQVYDKNFYRERI